MCFCPLFKSVAKTFEEKKKKENANANASPLFE